MIDVTKVYMKHGKILKVVHGKINRGNRGTNVIKVISPEPHDSVALIRFRLSNGRYTNSATMNQSSSELITQELYNEFEQAEHANEVLSESDINDIWNGRIYPIPTSVTYIISRLFSESAESLKSSIRFSHADGTITTGDLFELAVYPTITTEDMAEFEEGEELFDQLQDYYQGQVDALLDDYLKRDGSNAWKDAGVGVEPLNMNDNTIENVGLLHVINIQLLGKLLTDIDLDENDLINIRKLIGKENQEIDFTTSSKIKFNVDLDLVNNDVENIKELTASIINATTLNIGTFNITSLNVNDLTVNEILLDGVDLDTRIGESETEITKIKDGTTIVKKAEQDKEGNDIVDTYAKKDDLTTVYKASGSLTAAELVAGLLIDSNEGNVYNINEEFTTADDLFKEDDGLTFPAGTNVAVVKVGEIYKFDILTGMVDLSPYQEKTDTDLETTEKDIVPAINEVKSIADSKDVNLLEGVIVDGETLTIDGDKKVTIPVADDTGGSETDGLFTHEEKTKLAGVEDSADANVIEEVQVDGTPLTITEKSVNVDLSGKVDKVEGKELSDNNYDDTDKNKVDLIDITQAIDLDKATTKQLLTALAIEAPTSPAEGDIYYNTTEKKLFTYDGTGWMDSRDPEINVLYIHSSGVYVWHNNDLLNVTKHNDLDGRDEADAHPISSITGLAEALEQALQINIETVGYDSINEQPDVAEPDPDTLYIVDVEGTPTFFVWNSELEAWGDPVPINIDLTDYLKKDLSEETEKTGALHDLDKFFINDSNDTNNPKHILLSTLIAHLDIPSDVGDLTDNEDKLGDKNVQSDWEQVTDTEDDFIKNKPSNAVPTGVGETDGFMSHEDKAKLDGVEENANAYSLPVASATRGGVKADARSTETDTVEVKVGTDEKLYVPTYPIDTGEDNVLEGVKVNGVALNIDIDKNVDIPLVVPTGEGQKDGAMSHADKLKLDGVEAGAEVNVQSDWEQATDTEADFIKNKPDLDTKADINPSSQIKDANYTLDDGDEGTVILAGHTSDAVKITIPTHATHAFPKDTEIAIVKYDAGDVTIGTADGATLNGEAYTTTFALDDKYDSLALKKVADNEWIMIGSFEEVE